MKRWFLILPVFVVAYFLFKKEEVSVRVPASASIAPTSVVKPLILRPIGPAVVKVPNGRRVVKFPSVNDVRLPAALKINEETVTAASRLPLEQNGRRWRWLEGAVAVEANEQTAKLPRMSERPGYFVIAQNDLPPGLEGLPLVQREDNGLVGVFTGTLKAIGKSNLVGQQQFQSECPCRVIQSYPAIKSYLVSVSDSSHQELKTCLQTTGLFKKLEWEILDHSSRVR